MKSTYEFTTIYKVRAGLLEAWLTDYCGAKVPHSTIALFELRALCLFHRDNMNLVIRDWLELTKNQHRKN